MEFGGVMIKKSNNVKISLIDISNNTAFEVGGGLYIDHSDDIMIH